MANAHIGWFVGWTIDHITVDWGDNTSLGSASVVPIGDGSNWLEGSHTYASAGNYVVNVKVYMVDGTTATWSDAAVVATATPTAAASVRSKAKAVLGPVQGEWSAALPASASGVPTVVIHWGDSSKPDKSATVTVSNGRAYAVASHTYHKRGIHHATAIFKLKGKVIARVKLPLTAGSAA